jgi:hypothetical protein
MQRRDVLLALPAWLLAGTAAANPETGVVVIAHASVPRIDAATVARLYTGRAIEAGGIVVQVFNLEPGTPQRQRFLANFLQTDEERYRAYWTVRRHIGKGVPPRELASQAEMIELVNRVPGAVGYCDAAALKPGMNVICRV